MINNTNTRLKQVKTALINYITHNHLQRNDRLPSEATISKSLGVSRNTLREAYLLLENEGLIVRRHGLGTFIAQSPVLEDSLNEFLPFGQIIQAGGYTPRFMTLSNELEIAHADVCDIFKISKESILRRINRIVFANEQPVIFISDFIRSDIESIDLDWNDFDGNMVQFLSDHIDTNLYQIQSKIRAAALSTEIAHHLDLPNGTPVLNVRSTIFAIDNTAISYSNIYFNSNIIEMNTVRLINPK